MKSIFTILFMVLVAFTVAATETSYADCQGRGIYFSSADGAEKFKSDPDKYMKKLQGCSAKCCASKKEKGHDHDHDHDHDH